jgi:hypothetical protein
MSWQEIYDIFNIMPSKTYPLSGSLLRDTASLALITCLGVCLLSGCVKQRCYEDTDCPYAKICGPTGSCHYECASDPECGSGFRCLRHRCEAQSVASLDGEAPHPDASGVAEPGCAPGADDAGLTLDSGDRSRDASTDMDSNSKDIDATVGIDAADSSTYDSSPQDSAMDSGYTDAQTDERDSEIIDSGHVPTVCPADMALVTSVCIDRYEASRKDATGTSTGSDNSVATSRRGVLPWYVNPMSAAALETFQAACQAASKRLCSATEWFESCRGPRQTTYVFGNSWDPLRCNSVDTYCQQCCDILGMSPCLTTENCGYSDALSSSPYLPETCFINADYGLDTCHVCFHVMPTGSFPDCTNQFGLYDVNGNLWEVVPVSTDVDSRGYQVRGGAFNCASPSARFACSFNASWTALYAGFRCCKEPAPP